MERRPAMLMIFLGTAVFLSGCSPGKDGPVAVPTLPQPDDGASGEGGESVFPTLEELAAQIIEYIDNTGPPDEAFIKDLTGAVLIARGVGEKQAAEIVDNTVILPDDGSDQSNCGAACTISVGIDHALAIRIHHKLLEHEREILGIPMGNLGFYRALIHEASHASVLAVEVGKSREDYGVLGKLDVSNIAFGFTSGPQNQIWTLLDDLLFPRVQLDFYGSPVAYQIALLEEFYADWSAIEFFDRLIGAGLSKLPIMDTYRKTTITNYSILAQALVDVQDTTGVGGAMSWQDWWERKLTFDAVNGYHLNNERWKFFNIIGGVLGRANRNVAILTPQDYAALGLIGFTAWLLPDMSRTDDPRPVFTKLRTEPITEESLWERAEELRDWINDFPGIT